MVGVWYGTMLKRKGYDYGKTAASFIFTGRYHFCHILFGEIKSVNSQKNKTDLESKSCNRKRMKRLKSIIL